SLSTLIDKTRYRITFGAAASAQLAEQCVQFMAHNSFVIQRAKKGQVQNIDLRHEVSSLTACGDSLVLVAGRGKPMEFARAITGNPALGPGDIRVEKLDVLFLN
ncbi:MAG TPA: B12-binding domain-containing radical SAM protein, partial [Desulfuromonadaceae bacterium]